MRVRCRAGETDIVGEADVGLFKLASVVVQAGKYQEQCFQPLQICERNEQWYLVFQFLQIILRVMRLLTANSRKK